MLIGIVGKTNTGKSTFLKALTLADVEISNRVFTTIDPNHAVGYVKAKCPAVKVGTPCKPNVGYCKHGIRFIPVELLDVAGLVPGAHMGKGLGLKFLDDLRQADAFIHVIDVSGSTNENGEPVASGSYDPARDVRFLEEEIGYWFFGMMKKNWAKFSKEVEMNKKNITESLVQQFSGLKVTEDQIKKVLEKIDLHGMSPMKWSDNELCRFAFELRKLSKRMIIAANKIDVPGAEKNVERLREEFPNYTIIPCSAESELALKEAEKHGLIKYIPGSDTFEVDEPEKLSEKQKHALEFIRKNVLEKYGSTGAQECLDKVIFSVMDYIVAYPVANLSRMTDKKGNVLPDALLVPKGTKLKEFAAKVHTEMADKFIGGIDFETKRKLGAEHEVRDGDVIEILFGK
jgi:ribosome-binding ATPase YchF (GTP1/OBG family)